MANLYQLTNEYRELENMGLDEQTLADTLESIGGEFDDKADKICHVLANLSAQALACLKESDRLADRSGDYYVRINGLKNYLRTNMEILGKKKIESAKFTINCVAGRDKVNVTDEDAIPDKFFGCKPVEMVINKSDLLGALKAGHIVTGAELIKSKSSLRIK